MSIADRKAVSDLFVSGRSDPSVVSTCHRGAVAPLERLKSFLDARRKPAVWRYDYNNVRRHSSLGNRTPAQARRAIMLNGSDTHGSLLPVAQHEDRTGGLSLWPWDQQRGRSPCQTKLARRRTAQPAARLWPATIARDQATPIAHQRRLARYLDNIVRLFVELGTPLQGMAMHRHRCISARLTIVPKWPVVFFGAGGTSARAFIAGRFLE